MHTISTLTECRQSVVMLHRYFSFERTVISKTASDKKLSMYSVNQRLFTSSYDGVMRRQLHVCQSIPSWIRAVHYCHRFSANDSHNAAADDAASPVGGDTHSAAGSTTIPESMDTTAEQSSTTPQNLSSPDPRKLKTSADDENRVAQIKALNKKINGITILSL